MKSDYKRMTDQLDLLERIYNIRFNKDLKIEKQNAGFATSYSYNNEVILTCIDEDFENEISEILKSKLDELYDYCVDNYEFGNEFDDTISFKIGFYKFIVFKVLKFRGIEILDVWKS